MKYLCAACERLIRLTSFTVLEDGVLVATCPACGEKTRSADLDVPAALQATGNGAPSPTPPPPPRPAPQLIDLSAVRRAEATPPGAPRCPKCALVRSEEADACPRCGLVFANFRPEEFSLPEPIEALWSAAEAAWGEEVKHRAFIDACTSAGALAEAARRYRVKAEEMPRDALATRFRDEVFTRLLAATPRELAVEAPRRGNSFLLQGLVVVALVAFLGLIAWAVLSAARGGFGE